MAGIVAAAFRGKLPRLYELKETLRDPSHPDAYFQDFENMLQDDSVLSAFVKIEGWLAALDDAAWTDLKQRAAMHLVLQSRDSGRGWQALFDVFSEARAFGYLQSTGCTAVRFIKRDAAKTPDLGALKDGKQVLCEVKTINISKDEAEKRRRVAQGEFVVGTTSIRVDDGFLQKLRSTLKRAVEQLDSADPERKTRRLIFVVVRFDDSIGYYQQEYFAQIDEHLIQNPIESAKLVLCPADNLFKRSFTMRSATLLSE